MSEKTDESQKTEEPTRKRMQDARRKGDAPKSQEVTATVMLAAGIFAIWMLSSEMAKTIGRIGYAFLERPHAMATQGNVLVDMFRHLSFQLLIGLSGFALLVFGAALAGNVMQARPVWTTQRMKPSFEKISPLAGLKRIFGPTGWVNFAKGLGKLVIVGAVMMSALWADRHMITGLINGEGVIVVSVVKSTLLKLLIFYVLAMTMISALDFGWQVHSWKKRLRMTREEIKREHKETEGDPQTRARRNQIRQTQARRRTMEAVKKATVVIMNPTHFAVALHYDGEKQVAPICTAKGLDELALRMRQTAKDHDVPVIENPPLARALYGVVEIDEEIPTQHYGAVAKIIGFILSKSPSSGGLSAS